jgi:uncharacterized protein (TIGR02996 family)
MALLLDIEANPTNDRLRLVYADWLEDHGAELSADLIRVQCELKPLPSDDLRRPELEARELALRTELERSWLVPLCGGATADWQFERGLVAQVTLEVRCFLAHAEAICQETGVSRIRLFSKASDGGDRIDMHALAANPHLARVCSLDLTGQHLGAEEVQTLTRSLHLGELVELVLSHNWLGAEGAQVLARCPVLERLSCLHLGGNLIGDAGVRALAESTYLPALVELDLSANSITDTGLMILARSPLLDSVRILDLSQNALTTTGVRALVASPYLGKLNALNLRNNFLGPEAATLRACPRLVQCEGIDLHGNYLE